MDLDWIQTDFGGLTWMPMDLEGTSMISRLRDSRPVATCGAGLGAPTEGWCNPAGRP